MITEVELSPKERHEHYKSFRNAAIVVAIIFLCVSPLFYVVFKLKFLIVKLFISGILLYLILLFYNMLRKAYIDFNSNIKLQINGKVTKKYIKVKTSSSSTSSGSYGGGQRYSSGISSSSTIYLYFIELDGEKIQVEGVYYQSVEYGMYLNVYVSKGSRFKMD